MKHTGIPLSSLNRKMQAQVASLMDSGKLKPGLWSWPKDPDYSHIRIAPSGKLSEAFDAPTAALRTALSGKEEYPVFTLPYPPTLNHLFFTVGNRRVLSKDGRAYKQNAASLALTLGLKVLTGPVAITMEVYRPRKAGDLDNTFKIILDSLKGLAWEDDKQVVSIVARRFDDKENPRVRVRVEPAASLDPQLG